MIEGGEDERPPRERAQHGPHPADDVRCGLGDCGRGERQRGEERDRVPVNGTDEAGEPVEADPGPPVQVRLEAGEGKRAGGAEENGAQREAVEA